jgi:GDP/UDP-N,N'-diacetylbacillosamine 2-epimerase (hydrolysing)
MKMTKIGIITATRAEYGLLKPLYIKLSEQSEFNTELIVTGTHLLEKYGHTADLIEEDNIDIAHRVPIMHEDKNEPSEVVARAISSFNNLYIQEKYDAIVILGDRYELFGFAIPALLNRIPIVHLHGGEVTAGALDESVRHAITKLSAVHFASVEQNAKRIIQMGENPDYVFTVGAIGLDNILSLDLLTASEIGNELEVDFSKPVALVTFQPVTTDSARENEKYARELFTALSESELFSVVTMPNADKGSDEIMDVIDEFVKLYPEKFKFFTNLGTRRYLSAVKNCTILVGNTSSGIIEAPSFGIPTVNIGDRQAGRFAPETVINCDYDKASVLNAIEKGMSEEFRNSIVDYVNPYGSGNTASRIVSIMKTIDWKDSRLIKKEFRDL